MALVNAISDMAAILAASGDTSNAVTADAPCNCRGSHSGTELQMVCDRDAAGGFYGAHPYDI